MLLQLIMPDKTSHQGVENCDHLSDMMLRLGHLLLQVGRHLLFAGQSLLPGLQVALVGYEAGQFCFATSLLVAQVQPQGPGISERLIYISLQP